MSKESLVNYIQEILPMPVDKAEYIATFFSQKCYIKNDFLLKEGKICIESHFIESGFLRSYVVDVDGNEVTTDFYGNNIFANDFLSFFKRIPSNENIQVLADCTTWMINYEDLQTCFHTIPEFREFGRMMLINNYSRLKERMLGIIQLTAEQRYERLVTSHAEIFQNAPLKYIASYLGITDTSLSRIRKEIARSR
ncbi:MULTISPECIES: Crp/Fnr family transcriptional regulator [Emticicia]|uniref:Crp/Fnr family transcriptional regulator n=1 Tax=Emticicia TaxID=312278 RepID=UPI0007D8AF7A|nr:MULTISPECIES: Crp/Fnr family transcriptional regulator [Emticicia]